MAHDEKPKLLTFHTKIARHTGGNVVVFFFLKDLFQILKMTEFCVAPAIREKAAILA